MNKFLKASVLLAMELPDLHGAEDKRGFNDRRDVLVNQTKDGVDLNVLWNEFQQTTALASAARQTIVDFLTFSVTSPSEFVGQLSSGEFERASEYGEPKGVRQGQAGFYLGYDFGWYDMAQRFTWQFLADATAAQVQSLNAVALDADNRLVFTKVLEALYNKENRLANIADRDVNVYALYNADGTVPPKYKSNVFDGTHTHYLTSGATAVTPGDLDDLYEHLRHHGYGHENGVTQITLVNSREGKVIRGFKQANGATYDFIPAVGEPGVILPAGTLLVGAAQPSNSFAGLNVIGSYGYMLIVEDDLFPIGYMANVGTGGKANLNNPVGIREHENPSMRGLKLVQGKTAKYPLIDSFYNRGLGTGIRQRGGAAVMQITASGTYTAPAQYVIR